MTEKLPSLDKALGLHRGYMLTPLEQHRLDTNVSRKPSRQASKPTKGKDSG